MSLEKLKKKQQELQAKIEAAEQMEKNAARIQKAITKEVAKHPVLATISYETLQTVLAEAISEAAKKAATPAN